MAVTGKFHMLSATFFQPESAFEPRRSALLFAYSNRLFCVKKRTKKQLHKLTQSIVRDNSKPTCERLHEVV
jgi:hypothetical protein